MSTKVTVLPEEKSSALKDLQKKLVDAAKEAEKAIATAKSADQETKILDLELKVMVRDVFLELGLDRNCQVNLETGDITWPEVPTGVEPPVMPVTPAV